MRVNPCKSVSNGAKRTRTADPLNAIEVLYQLSYSPLHNAAKHNSINDILSRRRQRNHPSLPIKPCNHELFALFSPQ